MRRRSEDLASCQRNAKSRTLIDFGMETGGRSVAASANLEPGAYHVEILEPSGGQGKGADIDVIGISPQ